MNSSFYVKNYFVRSFGSIRELYRDKIAIFIDSPYIRFLLFLSAANYIDASTLFTSVFIFLNKNNLIGCDCCSINIGECYEVCNYVIGFYNDLLQTKPFLDSILDFIGMSTMLQDGVIVSVPILDISKHVITLKSSGVCYLDNIVIQTLIEQRFHKLLPDG
jgi:hypothetical protein